MEQKEITLDSLIDEGIQIKKGLRQKTNDILGRYFFADRTIYEVWKNNVKRFLSLNYPNDFQIEDINKAISSFEYSSYFPPYKLDAIIGIIKSYKQFSQVIIKVENDISPNIGTLFNINNTLSQNQSQQQSQSVEIFIEAIKDDLTGKQVKELKEIVAAEDNNLEKAKPKILEKTLSWGGDVAAGIVTNLITNPSIWVDCKYKDMPNRIIISSGKRTLEHKLYALSNYLIKCGIPSFIESHSFDFLKTLYVKPKLIADWSEAISKIDHNDERYPVVNISVTQPKGELFFWAMDYYWCNNMRTEFSEFVSSIISEFIKAHGDRIDINAVVAFLQDLGVDDSYLQKLKQTKWEYENKKKSLNRIKEITTKHLNKILEPKIETVKPINDEQVASTFTEEATKVIPEYSASDYFKLISLRIINFKNIKDIELDFTETNGVSIIIGNNGCGKSNITEAIASIFAGLYKNKIHKPNFEYELKYQINRNNIEITLKSSKYTIKVNEKTVTKTTFESKSNEYLPNNVIACYSGENLRLFNNYFGLYYKEYIDSLKKSADIPELKLIYINKYCWNFALLTLFMYDFEVFTDMKKFCCNTLKIKELCKITFHIDYKKLSEWNDNQVVMMMKKLLNYDGVNYDNHPNGLSLSLSELKDKLDMPEKDFFLTMYAACMPKADKLITSIALELIMDNEENCHISVDDLSEGEKKYMLLRLILEVVGDQNSLLLFDEPDAHIHISRKSQLKELFTNFPNRENILTTHSPTLAMCFDEKNIISLGKDEKGNTKKISSEKRQLISEITEGRWNAHEQNMFLASNKKIILLVEGKTDKQHIELAYQWLRDEYPNLEFDVFNMNGETFIRQTIIGLSNSELQWDKKIIGIFDNDDAGKKACKDGFKGEENFLRINYNNVPSNTFFATLLPKTNDFDEKTSFTIENCYDALKYEEAYIKSVEDKKGNFSRLSIDKISDDIKNRSKIILSDHAKSFVKKDFDGFKPLFNIINRIRIL